MGPRESFLLLIGGVRPHLSAVLCCLFVLQMPTFDLRRAEGAQNLRATSQHRFKCIDLYVDQALLDEMYELLSLSEDNQAKTIKLFESYFSEITQLDRVVMDRVEKAGFKETIRIDEEARRKGEDPPWDQLDKLRFQFRTKLFEGKHEGDLLLDKFLSDFQIKLDLSETNSDNLQRLVRRRNYFRIHAKRRERDFASPLDLTEIVAIASQDGGELELLRLYQIELSNESTQSDSRLSKELKDKIRDSGLSLDDIMLDYEKRLDTFILKEWIGKRQVRPSRTEKTLVTSSDTKYELKNRKFIRSWKLRNKTWRRSASLISSLLEQTVGLEASHTWQARLDQQFCPNLTGGNRWADNMVEWITNLPNHSSEQLDTAKDLHAEYKKKKKHLLRAVINAGINSKEKHVFPDGTEPLQLKFAKAKFELHKLSRSTILSLRRHLNSDQKEKLDMEINGRPHLLGPTVQTNALEELGILEQYRSNLGARKD